MSLFRKKEKIGDCDGKCNESKNLQNDIAKVKILGSGCAKCNQLEANTLDALKYLKISTAIEHITDFAEIATYGVITTPAIVFNDKVLSYGKVLKTNEIIAMIEKEV